MRILNKYIVREVLVFFSISLAAFTGLLLTVRMLRLTSLIINRGVEFSQIAKVFVSIIPTFLEIALPMATLLGVMLAFARLCGDSEMVVIRASGISFLKFLKPIAAFAIFVTLLSLLVSLVLRPWGFNSLSKALFEVAKSRSTSGLNEGVFNKLGNITLYAERIDYASGDLHRVLVDDKRDEKVRKVVVAKRGKIITDESSQSIYLLLGDGIAHEEVDGKYVRTGFSSNSIAIDADEILRGEGKKGVVARELSTPELKIAIQDFESAINVDPSADIVPFRGLELLRKDILRKLRRAKIELGQRYSLPYATFIMAFVGMALGIVSPRTQRAWGAGVSAVLALIVFIIYYGLLSMGFALADSGKMNIGTALWLPNIVTSVIAVLFIKQISSERWSSVPEGLQNAVRKMTSWLPKRSAA